MFPLSTTTFPSSRAELVRLLNEAIRRLFVVEADPVTILEESYPHLKELSVSLDGAQFRANSPRPAIASGKTSPALTVDRFILSASPLSLGPAPIDLVLSAREVGFGQGKDSNDQIVLSLENAADGRVEISATQTDLESIVVRLARDRAGQQGITIESAQLKLKQENPHSLSAEVLLRARKLFLSFSIRVTGQIELDDQLTLKISRLDCTGDGAVASLACGILKPYLQKIDGYEFPLMSLPLGKIQLRDVRLMVGNQISITAEFGSAAVDR